jgi:hypothetical protein
MWRQAPGEAGRQQRQRRQEVVEPFFGTARPTEQDRDRPAGVAVRPAPGGAARRAAKRAKSSP